MSDKLHIWTIYRSPSDYPGEHVARLYVVDGGPNYGATDRLLRGPDLESVRAQLPPGLYCMPRQPDDDPVIVESWL